MDIQENNQLFKARSYAACIREGFKLIANHPKTLLTATWPYILLTAFFGWLYYEALITIFKVGLQEALTPWVSAKIAVSYLLLVIATLFLTARVMLVFKYLHDNGNLARIKPFSQMGQTCAIVLRILFFVVLEIIITIVLGAAMSFIIPWALAQETSTMMVTIILVTFLACLLIMILLLPLIQPFYAFVINGGDFMKTLSSGYKKGLRHIGKILTTNILAVALTSLLTLFVSLPLFVLLTANVQSSLGTLILGDASGMPSYMPWLMAITFIVCLSFAIYCYFFVLTSNLYVYGSIEAIEAEKNKYKDIEFQGV